MPNISIIREMKTKTQWETTTYPIEELELEELKIPAFENTVDKL